MSIRKLRIVFSISIILTLVLGIFYINYVWQKSIEKKSQQALLIAETAARGLDGEMLKLLRAVPEDVETVAYISLKKRLIDLIKVDPNIRFAYFYTQRDNKLYFMVDSEPEESLDLAPAGMEYIISGTEYSQPFKDGNSLITKPATDQWGKWISILVPIKNNLGQITSVFSIDYPASNWNNQAIYRTWEASFIVIIILILELAFYKLTIGLVKKREDEKKFKDLYNLSLADKKLLENTSKKNEDQAKEIYKKIKESEEQKLAILNILEDVEKEKNKAEELSAIVRDANEPIVSQNLEGIILNWNKGAEHLYGYSSQEITGKSINIIIPEDKQEEYIKIKEKILKGEKINHYQTVRKKKDGTFVDVDISLSPVKDFSDKIIAISVITLDITKEKEVDRAKTEFVSLASHQLRTPLSSINWYTEMLLAGDAGKINENQKKYLEEVSYGSQRMVALVDSLLNVSRLDLGTFIIEPEPVKIIEMAKSVVEEMKPQVLEKEIKVEEVYNSNISEFQADKKLLRMIFQNLLSNAVKYTRPKGNVKIDLAIKKKDEDFGNKKMNDDSVVIVVSDDGIGIPAGQKDKIFTKMFRADNARESETEGTGLGLYIIKSIVDKSGGEIWFNSEENNGTTFYVSFPISGMKKKEGSKKLD